MCIRGKTPWGIVTKLCLWIDTHAIITYATFGDDRLRGLGVARGRISRFPINLRRRPYNTLALPYEYVVQVNSSLNHTVRTTNIRNVCAWARFLVHTIRKNIQHCLNKNSADADKPRDAFIGQSRSPNMVPFDMLGMVSY